MRRILFPILIIGVVAGMFSIGSGAFFSDTETSTANVFTAGTLNLTLDGGSAGAGDSVTGTFVFGPLKPATRTALL